jgi:hypothetical protein
MVVNHPKLPQPNSLAPHHLHDCIKHLSFATMVVNRDRQKFPNYIVKFPKILILICSPSLDVEHDRYPAFKSVFTVVDEFAKKKRKKMFARTFSENEIYSGLPQMICCLIKRYM